MSITAGQDIRADDFINKATKNATPSNDVGRVIKNEAHGFPDSGFVRSTFGGDGSDGPLAITSGTTTIDVGGAAYYEKNYEYISITGSAKLAFINPHANGTVIVLKCLGKLVLTSSTVPNIDASSMGAAGGANAVTSINQGASGTAGKTCSVFQTPASGVGSPTPGGKSLTSMTMTLDVATFLPRAVIRDYPLIFVGGGGAGASCANTTGSAGTGGRGGACLIIECNGDVNFTVANGISVAGGVGSNATCTGNSNGAGGGGGGMCALFYRSATAVSGTINKSGGTGGSPTGLGTVGTTGENGLSHVEQIK